MMISRPASEESSVPWASYCFLGLYCSLSFWLTLRPLELSFHQRSNAASALNNSKGGPSTLISKRSFNVVVLRLVLRSVFMIFSLENSCSTLLVVNGRLKTRWHKQTTFCQLLESGHVSSLNQILRYVLCQWEETFVLQPLIFHPESLLQTSH